MCGIAGAIRKILPPRTAAGVRSEAGRLVEAMTAAQRHRGPDGSGLRQSSGQEVIFGHRRLAS
jgi:asparagine synthetase B (glutamine-hydrolysing)